MLRAFLVLPLALLGVVFVAAGCQSLPSVTATCGEIPPNGCPTGRGGTCADATCAALYECVNSVWTVSETCPTQPAVAKPVVRSVAVAGPAGVAIDGGACTPVNIDVSGQTNDCMVDLMFPDCPARAAQGCVENVCLTGCSDFFVCSSAAWIDVAHCDDFGRITVTQQHFTRP
jgi:hypothetical protein